MDSCSRVQQLWSFLRKLILQMYMYMVYVYGINCSNFNAISSQAGTIHLIKLALHVYCLWLKENKIFHSILYYSDMKIDEKLNWRQICKILFFFFWSHFLRFCIKASKKCSSDPPNNFPLQINPSMSKNAEFGSGFKAVEIVAEKLLQTKKRPKTLGL